MMMMTTIMNNDKVTGKFEYSPIFSGSAGIIELKKFDLSNKIIGKCVGCVCAFFNKSMAIKLFHFSCQDIVWSFENKHNV